MPEWWLEAVIPGTVFGAMLALWVILPAREGEWDFGARIRWVLRGGRPPYDESDPTDSLSGHVHFDDEAYEEQP